MDNAEKLPGDRTNFLEALHETFAAQGGVDLEIPPRHTMPDRELQDLFRPEHDSVDPSTSLSPGPLEERK